MMNPQEFELASKIMGELRNTTGYGYEALVKGTVISGLLDASVIVLAVIAAAVSAHVAYKHQSRKKEPTYDDIPPFWCAVICFICFGFVSLVVFALLSGAMMAIFTPEYTVINKIIEKAAGQ